MCSALIKTARIRITKITVGGGFYLHSRYIRRLTEESAGIISPTDGIPRTKFCALHRICFDRRRGPHPSLSMAAPKPGDDLIETMTEQSRDLLKISQSLTDCCVLTADGFEFKLHKMVLTQQSVVLGCASSHTTNAPHRQAGRWRLRISIATHLNASSDRYALIGLCCTVSYAVNHASYSQCRVRILPGACCMNIYVHYHKLRCHASANWQQRASTYFAENVDMQL